VATSLTLNLPLPTLVPGGSGTASAAAYNCASERIPVSWRSSDAAVATVSAAGVIHALYPGITYITAYNGVRADSAQLIVKLNQPAIDGSVVFDPSYPTGMAHLSWPSVLGATSYRIFRKCRMADGYTPGWDLWTETSDTNWSGDYVTGYAGIFPPDGSYIAYYVVATGDGGNESPASEIRYFTWDEVAEPGC
jgi:hypothetical protein